MIVNTLRLGPVYTDWTGEDDHTLCFDLIELKFFVDSKTQFMPLSVYLRDHPETRFEVANLLRTKLG